MVDIENIFINYCGLDGTLCKYRFRSSSHRCVPDARRDWHDAERDMVGEEFEVPAGEGLVAPRPIVDSDHTQHARHHLQSFQQGGRGNVAVIWSVAGLLLCLRFAMSLKPGAFLKVAVADAVRLIHGNEGGALAEQIESGELALPGLDLMRQARLRIDLLCMLYQRVLNVIWYYIRFVYVDSSPQLGRNYLCVREDRVRFPRALMYNAELRAHYDLNEGFETRIMALSSLGCGRGSGLKKSTNVSCLYLAESDDEDGFEEIRCNVFGVTTDQGAERGIVDEAVGILEAFRGKYSATDPKSFLWPNALMMVGHLHVLFNALAEACKHLDVSEDFFATLAILCAFMSNVQLRRKFQATCVAGKAIKQRLDHFTKTHVDWRWEFLGPALERIGYIIIPLAEHFALEGMLASEQGKGECKLLRDLHAVLSDISMFRIHMEMFAVIASIVEFYSSKLEGCLCHGGIWRQKRKFSARVKEVQRDTGYAHCVWKGRMGAWWAAVGLKEMLSKIATASSDKLDALLWALSPDARARAVHTFQQLRSKLMEILTEKSVMWHRIPWKVIGVFYCCQGGPVELCKNISRECITEYDDAVAAGLEDTLHRVAIRLLSPSRIVGQQLRDWLVSDTPLISFAHAFLLPLAVCHGLIGGAVH